MDRVDDLLHTSRAAVASSRRRILLTCSGLENVALQIESTAERIRLAERRGFSADLEFFVAQQQPSGNFVP
jgi:hypothetical protein